jgi:hypoxanthine-guanine phosphoribosyltransferase
LQLDKDIVLFNNSQILQYIDNVAQEILLKSNEYDLIHIICILEGGKEFCNHLEDILLFQKEIYISEIKITATKDNALLDKPLMVYDRLPSSNFFDEKKVVNIIVDDLVDSAKSINLAKEYLSNKGFENIYKVALINKYQDNIDVCDIVGVNMKLHKTDMKKKGIEDYWLYGFGMDLDGEKRDLKEIRAIVKNVK